MDTALRTHLIILLMLLILQDLKRISYSPSSSSNSPSTPSSNVVFAYKCKKKIVAIETKKVIPVPYPVPMMKKPKSNTIVVTVPEKKCCCKQQMMMGPPEYRDVSATSLSFCEIYFCSSVLWLWRCGRRRSRRRNAGCPLRLSCLRLLWLRSSWRELLFKCLLAQEKGRNEWRSERIWWKALIIHSVPIELYKLQN